jgi:3-isopropylmalate dehydratase small subunit
MTGRVMVEMDPFSMGSSRSLAILGIDYHRLSVLLTLEVRNIMFKRVRSSKCAQFANFTLVFEASHTKRLGNSISLDCTLQEASRGG